MTEKLAQLLGTEQRRLKVGKSFEQQKGHRNNSAAYNAIKYDFKPHSIDEERDGTFEVRENNSVAVSHPHVDGAGQTNYKGHLNPSNTKDCVLIIDHDTGEITIERLSHQILLKKTRPEKNDTKGLDEKPPSNPYEVKRIPDKPSFSGREQPTQQKKPDFPSSNRVASPTLPHKSRPPPPSHSKPAVAPQSTLDESSSSSSSDSGSDSDDSDFEEDSKPQHSSSQGGGGGSSNMGMPSFGGGAGVLPTARPQQRHGGVMPTARPSSHNRGVLPSSRPPPQHQSHSNKSSKSFGSDSGKSKSKSQSSNMPVVGATGVANLDDDLRLSDSD